LISPQTRLDEPDCWIYWAREATLRSNRGYVHKKESLSALDNRRQTIYKRGFSTPILICLDESEAAYTLADVHGGISRHLGGRALAKKVLRKGYYWPTMTHDAMKFVKKSEQCQRHGDVQVAPRTHHFDITMALLKMGYGRFRALPQAPSQLKFLIVVVGYCTKWIGVEPLASRQPTSLSSSRKLYWPAMRSLKPSSWTTDPAYR